MTGPDRLARARLSVALDLVYEQDQAAIEFDSIREEITSAEVRLFGLRCKLSKAAEAYWEARHAIPSALAGEPHPGIADASRDQGGPSRADWRRPRTAL